MKISACMIAKNESKNIRKCIESYKDIVNEIIVVDTGSTDDTVEIAQSLGAKVYHEEWKNDFAAAKNVALNKAKGDWIIFLDADEYFSIEASSKLVRNIKRVHKNRQIEALSCMLYNINDYDEKKIIEMTPVLRVFRNENEIKFEGKIHEATKKYGRFVSDSMMEDVIIYHTGYSREIVDSKIKRNFELLEVEVEKEDVNPLIYYYLAESCVFLKKYKEAKDYADTFLEKDIEKKLIKTIPLTFRVFKYKSIAMSYLKLSFEETLKTIRQGIEIFPFHPELKNEEARILRLAGHYELAVNAYKESIILNKNYNQYYSNNYEIMKDQVLYDIGQIYMYKNEEAEAFDYFLEAIKKNKYNIQAFKGLMDLIKYQDLNEIIEFLNTVYDFSLFDDIKFLAIYLARKKIKEPFLYFFIKKWSGDYDNYGTLMTLAYLLNNNTQKALDVAYSCHGKESNEEHALYVIISLIIGNHRKWYEENKQNFKTEFEPIIEYYFNKKEIKGIDKNDNDNYLKILSELITFEDTSWFVKFIEDTPVYVERNLEEIGDVLKKNKYYEVAIDYYKRVDNSQNENQQNINFKIAFTFYQFKAYIRSIEYYEKGLKVDSESLKTYEPVSILNWIIQQTKDDTTIEKAKNLIEQFEKCIDKNNPI